MAASASALQYTATGGGLSALADVTFGAGTVSITLQNLTANPTSVGQLINGITFNVAGLTNTAGFVDPTSVTAPNGLANISAGGAYTAAPTDLSRWDYQVTGGNLFTFTTLSGGNPDRLIIGPDASNNFTYGGAGDGYTNANASILGDNPSILGSLSATFLLPGVTSNTSLTNLNVRFNTDTTTLVPGVPAGGPGTGQTNVPDGGSTVVLAGIALLGLAALRHFRR
jgi:hypothetical protein